MSQSHKTIDIREVGVDSLSDYAKIPIAIKVDTIFRVDPIENGLGGLQFLKEEVERPYLKDYDAIEGEGSIRLEQWPDSFDVSDWGIFLAYNAYQPQSLRRGRGSRLQLAGMGDSRRRVGASGHSRSS